MKRLLCFLGWHDIGVLYWGFGTTAMVHCGNICRVCRKQWPVLPKFTPSQAGYVARYLEGEQAAQLNEFASRLAKEQGRC